MLLKYKRKIIQLTIAILYNLNFNGFKNISIYNGKTKQICAPGLNCYSCPGAVFSCPIGCIQRSFQNNSSFIKKIPFYSLGLIILFGVICGRVVCGFLCPFGLIQEILYYIKTPKIKKNNMTKKLTYVKYLILFLFVIILPIIYFEPSFCKYICPQGTLEAGLFFTTFSKEIGALAGNLFKLKTLILSMILIMSIFIYRFFCRFICPLGALYSFFNKISIFGIKVDNTKCIKCNKCINTCKMDVSKVGDRECINCGECIDSCKEKAIKLGFK